MILNKVTRSKSTGGFHTRTDGDRKYHFNIMALASDIRATKNTAQAQYDAEETNDGLLNDDEVDGQA